MVERGVCVIDCPIEVYDEMNECRERCMRVRTAEKARGSSLNNKDKCIYVMKCPVEAYEAL
jgi:hypothetical protein